VVVRYRREVYSSPAIGTDGTVYIGSDDAKLYALNPDGTLKWTYTTGGSIGYSSPAIGEDGTVYVGSQDTKLYAIRPDGSLNGITVREIRLIHPGNRYRRNNICGEHGWQALCREC